MIDKEVPEQTVKGVPNITVADVMGKDNIEIGADLLDVYVHFVREDDDGWRICIDDSTAASLIWDTSKVVPLRDGQVAYLSSVILFAWQCILDAAGGEECWFHAWDSSDPEHVHEVAERKEYVRE